MIDKEHLQSISIRKQLQLRNAEKDYLLEIVLYALCRYSKRELIFKGGTALYKHYGLNRFSEDLDFTLTKRKFDMQFVLEKMRKELSFLGIEMILPIYEQYPNEINTLLQIKGPLYDGSKASLSTIRINVSTRERIIHKPVQELLLSQYGEVPSFEVFVMDTQEMLAEKIRAIYTREKARDVYDVWFLLKRGVKPDTSLIQKKLDYYKKKHSLSLFLTCIEKKKQLWNNDLHGLIIGTVPPFERIMKEIRMMMNAQNGR